MSNHVFNAKQGPILVEVEAVGPTGIANLKLVLDTGATTTLINLSALLYLGFDPDQSPQRVRMTTGSSVEVVPVVILTRLGALGQHRFGFPVIAHALPAGSARGRAARPGLPPRPSVDARFPSGEAHARLSQAAGGCVFATRPPARDHAAREMTLKVPRICPAQGPPMRARIVSKLMGLTKWWLKPAFFDRSRAWASP